MRVFGYFALFLLWNVVAGGVLIAGILVGQGLAGIVGMLAISAWLLWRVALRPATPRRRWSLLRLRPLRGEALLWTIVAVPVMLTLSWALGDIWTSLLPVPVETLDPFAPFMTTPVGRLGIAVMAVAVAPVFEEFFFRGFIQRLLERRYGRAAGIGGQAALFAAMHLLPWVLPLHFVLGLILGYTVWATRSIWAGILLHTANNAVAILARGTTPQAPAAEPAELGSALLLLLASTAAWLYVAGRLRRAGLRG